MSARITSPTTLPAGSSMSNVPYISFPSESGKRGPEPIRPWPLARQRRLPPEICHLVFEHLKYDKKTLLSSSTISRYWREVSLPWLFAHITILSAPLLTIFLEFIDTCPHLGVHVRRLSFNHRSTPGHRSPEPIHEDNFRALLSSAISKLPSLYNLSLDNVRLGPGANFSSTFALVDFEHRSPSNRRLRTLSIHVPNVDQASWTATLAWFLTTYAVDTLELAGVDVSLPDDFDDSIAASGLSHVQSSIQVSNLVFHGYPSGSYHDTYPFFETFLQPDSLRTISTCCGSSPDIRATLRFMEVVGQNVTYLSLDVVYLSVEIYIPFAPDPDWETLGGALAYCPHLERLRIQISGFNVHDYSYASRDPVFTTILTRASRTLHTLTIELTQDREWHRSMGDFETWDLHALSAYLTREPAEFPSLRSVVVELTLFEADDNEELAEYLSGDLEALKEAGLLRVFCDEMSQSSRDIFGFEPFPMREE